MDFNEFKTKYEHVPVQEYLDNACSKPVVSVCIQTFNHAPYISQCLESILSQKTNFEFEILIGEDGSTDGNRALCMEYAKKYPSKIRLFLHHRENNIKYDGRPTPKFNALFNFFNANGKYIALCEGDDYWNNPLKLQSQFDYLENNEAIAFCFHDSYEYIQEEDEFKNLHFPFKKNTTGLVSTKPLFKNLGGSYPTASSFFRRNIVVKIPRYFLSFSVGDSPLILRAIECGNIAYIAEKWSVYRTTKTNWSSGQKILSSKLSHYNHSILGINQFQECTKGKFKKEVAISKSHLTYQLLFFYISSREPFTNKLKYVLKYFSLLNFLEKLKIIFRFIQFSFK